MTAPIKRIAIVGSLMVGVLLFTLWLARGRSRSVAVTVSVLSVATNPGTASSALFDVKLVRPAVVSVYAVEYKVGDQWLSQTPVPKLLTDEFENIFSVRAALGGRCQGILHGPTNCTWRVTFEVVEPRTGWAGLRERLQKPTGYRRVGGWSNVLLGTWPVRYTGRAYFLPTEEIVP